MTSLTNRVSTLIILIWLSSACTMCPLDCLCRLDEKARRRISCFQGGLIGSVPAADINKNTQVLEIRAPREPDKQNWLAIGGTSIGTGSTGSTGSTGTGLQSLQSLVNLEELHIVHSNIPEISKHAFWGLKKLETLSLMENNISVLHDHNFRGLANLKQLYLDGNQITRLVSGGFKYLTDLRVLSLAKNRLQELDARVFEKLANLHRLNLSGNRFKDLYPEVFMDIQELRIFECRQCALRNINTQIYHLLPHLESLDLGDNDFFYLTNDEFHDLRRLQHLWLDGNHLAVVLEHTFVRQRQLQMISLARNRLAKVTNTAFANATTLKELDLSYNKLMKLDADVFHPIEKSLERLDLSGNHLFVPDLNLQSLTNLQYLGLADMNLTQFPTNLFLYHPKLETLNLSGNLVESVDVRLQFHQNLKELDLSRNRVQGLDERSLDKLGRVQTIHLAGNPWACDLCHILPLLYRVHNNRSLLVGKMGVTTTTTTTTTENQLGYQVRGLLCTTPAKLRARQLQTLRESDLTPCHKLNSYETNDLNFFSNIYTEYGHIIIIFTSSVSVVFLLFGSIAFVRVCCFARHQHRQRHQQQNYYMDTTESKFVNVSEQPLQLPPSTLSSHPHQETIFGIGENATAIFAQNGEISFKFPLDLSEKNKMISTIGIVDDISCKQTRFPNGDL